MKKIMIFAVITALFISANSQHLQWKYDEEGIARARAEFEIEESIIGYLQYKTLPIGFRVETNEKSWASNFSEILESSRIVYICSDYDMTLAISVLYDIDDEMYDGEPDKMCEIWYRKDNRIFLDFFLLLPNLDYTEAYGDRTISTKDNALMVFKKGKNGKKDELTELIQY